MLSILIPTFNYDCRQLVIDVHKQCSQLGINFEIRVYDDFSTIEELKNSNNNIAELRNVIFIKLEKNLGFCKIRNLLAQDASNEKLLFLDADISIPEDFIAKYLANNTIDVQCGGIVYTSQKPHNHKLFLKWKHGKTREELTPSQRDKNPYRSISAANIYIKKDTYLQAKMDEESTGYGYNDTMLGYKLKLINASIKHIDNPVLHEGLMEADKFILRSMEAMKNLLFFSNQPYIKSDFNTYIKVLKVYEILKKTHAAKWYLAYYKYSKGKWIKNLKSESPHLRNLDKLKLGKLIELKVT